MGSSVQPPKWYAPPTNEGKSMPESLSEMIGAAPVFDEFRTEPEISFLFGRRTLIIQVAKVGGGTLFKTYDGEWIAAILYGKEVLHSQSDLYSRNPLDHYGAAILYAGVLFNNPNNGVPAWCNSALHEFWSRGRNFEVLTP